MGNPIERAARHESRGYFGIGICGGKTPVNLGTLWRSAYQMGAAFIFTVGHRYPKQPSDTVSAWKHVPLYEYATPEIFLSMLPKDCYLIGVEFGGRDLMSFSHPERAVYLLGAEDHGLSADMLARCHRTLEIPSMRALSYNVAVAGSIVMYDRMAKSPRTTPGGKIAPSPGGP